MSGLKRFVDFPAISLPVARSRFALRRADFEQGSAAEFRFTVENHSSDSSVLHVRFPIVKTEGISVSPEEMALGAGEVQAAILRVDPAQAKRLLAAGNVSGASLSQTILFTYLRESGQPTRGEGRLFVRLPISACPNCGKVVADDDAGEHGVPDICPFCFERLRACPICGTPNTWLARTCVADESHVVRASLDFPITPGGDAAHSGDRSPVKATTALSRRWSFPNVAPARRESALFWSAPVAAYGLIAAAASDPEGDASIFAWDARRGSPLWDSYPLPDPVYPERGGLAIAGGRLFAATVEGVCLCLDALRGTRVWETKLPRPDARVFGAVVPVRFAAAAIGDATPAADLLLVPATLGEEREGGALYVLDAETGAIRREVLLAGGPDTSPAFADGRVFIHDDSGTLTAFDPLTGAILWQSNCAAGFDAAPVVSAGGVFSATSLGELLRHDAATGELSWRLAVTNAPLSGTPASDGSLVYVPADDGLHVISTTTGRSVRRFGARRPVRSSPVMMGDNTLFWGGTDGNVYGARGGGIAEVAYTTGTPGSQIVSSLAVADGLLFVVATNGVLYALEYTA